MPRIAVGIEYDGAAYAGWQSQRGPATIQQHLEAALSVVAGDAFAIVGAGRTDAGVHARAQVAHFDTPVTRTSRSWILGANTNLPDDISVRWACEVPEHFHARYSALSRCYRYCILNRPFRSGLNRGRTAFVYQPVQLQPMRAAAAHLIGLHDFSSFRAAECQAKSPVRNLFALRLAQQGDFIVIEVQANAFLQHMVRNIAGLLLAVGRGDRPAEWALEVLAARDRRCNAATAPPGGLYFWSVQYPPVFGLPDDSAMMRSPVGCPGDFLDQVDQTHVMV